METINLQQLTTYMNNLFNSTFYKQLISSNTQPFNELSNILLKYYISTLDDSEESIKYLSLAYLTCQKEKRDFINEVYIPYIYEKIKRELNIEGELSTLDKIKIALLLKQRNFNKYYTHCFPGALYEEIKANGLDIKKELFTKELSMLERQNKTSYKTGALCYCELSAASLSYATSGLPERIKFALGIVDDPKLRLPKKEYYRELFKRAIEEQIKNGTLKKEVAPSYEEIGLRVLDFYCSSTDSCIALFRDPKKDYSQTLESFITTFCSFNLEQISKTTIGKQIIERLNKISDPIKRIEELDLILIELNNTNPLLKEIIQGIIDDKLLQVVSQISISNLLHGGFADGYEVEGGSLSPKEFTIIKFPTPRETYLEHSTNLELPTVELPPKKKNQELLIRNYQGIDRALNESLKYPNITRIEILYNKELKKPSNLVMYTTQNEIILPNNYLIKQENGIYTYSLFSPKVLKNKLINQIFEKLAKQDKESINKIVEKYKQTNNYHSDYYANEEELIDDALDWYAKVSIDNTPPEKVTQLINALAASDITFTLQKKDNKVVITSSNKEYIMESDVLVDSTINAPYNDYYYNILQSPQEGFKF